MKFLDSNLKKIMNINIAVVGCGYWGKNFVRNIYELNSLYCISETNEETAKLFTNTLGVPNYSFDKILEDKNINGVILAVPAEYHAEMAIKVMEAKKHVFVEKPLAMNSYEANSMIQTSQTNKVNLMVGHLLQYHPAFIKLKEMCDGGAIGDIRHITSNRMSLGKVRSEEDVIWSFAPHDLSMILSIINKPVKSVYASGSSIIQDKICDIASIDINFTDNIKAKVSASWLSPFKEHKLTVIGEKGMLVFDDTNGWDSKLVLVNYTINKKNKETQLIKKENAVTLDESEPLKNECLHFINLIDNKVKNITSGFEGLEVLKILTSCSDSLKLKDIIYLKNES